MSATDYATKERARREGAGVRDARAIPELIARLADQASTLARSEVKLVQAEIIESLNDMKTGMTSALIAAVVGVAGLGVVLMGIAYLLAEALPLWGATLIVGVVTLAVAGVLALAAKKKMSASQFRPKRTERTLRSNTRMMKDKVRQEA